MSSKDGLESRFHEDDDDSSYAITSSNTSDTVAGSASRTLNSRSTRASSSSVAGPSVRAAPYPKPQERRSSAGPGARGNGKGKSKETAFMQRARNAPDDDDGFILGNSNSQRDDYMDIDSRFDRYGRAGDGIGEGGPEEDIQTGEGVDVLKAVEEREARESDVKKLMRAWQNERHAPDILPAKDVLLGRVLDGLRRQMNDVNALRGAEDISEEDHYMTMLVQTEVERIKFIVRSYVRTRLFKIEEFAAYITTKPEIQTRLTEVELGHAQRYAKLVVSQFNTTVLNHLPEAQRALDDEVLTMPSMITEPDKNRPVFCRNPFGPVRLGDLTKRMENGETVPITVDKGRVFLTSYKHIEQLLLRDEVELV